MSHAQLDVRPLEGLRKLKGHTAMVTSAALCSSDVNVIATGSEDGFVRLWDMRTATSIRRLTCGAPVSCILTADTVDGWTCGSGNRLLSFDLRGSNRVLVDESKILVETSDDINDMDCIREGEIKQYLCVDDDGKLTFTGNDKKTIHAHPKSIGMCVKAISNDLIVSGGFDNALVFSTYSQSKELARLPLLPSGDMTALFNPPHVHSLDVSFESGQNGIGLLVVAVGDGSVAFFETWHGLREKTINWHKVQQSAHRIPRVHMAPTACVRFVQPELAGSVGNDKVLALIAKSRSGRPRAVAKYEVPASPNTIVFPKGVTGSVLICDVEAEAKLGLFARS